jgi:hypothetical protein
MDIVVPEKEKFPQLSSSLQLKVEVNQNISIKITLLIMQL